MKRPIKPKQQTYCINVETLGDLRDLLSLEDDSIYLDVSFSYEKKDSNEIYQQKLEVYEQQLKEYKKYRIEKLQKELEENK